jgi:hypothetical protein
MDNQSDISEKPCEPLKFRRRKKAGREIAHGEEERKK